jgi:hypothetical protein
MLAHSSALVVLADSGGLVAFYQKFLAQDPILHRPGIYTEFQLADLRLGIFQPKQPEEFPAGKSSISICLEVPDLAAVCNDLARLDIAVSPIFTASHGQEVYVYDPTGNRWIIHQGLS